MSQEGVWLARTGGRLGDSLIAVYVHMNDSHSTTSVTWFKNRSESSPWPRDLLKFVAKSARVKA